MKLSVHIVQKMAPGGIETLVLRLSESLPGKHIVLSLEESTANLMGHWPELKNRPIELIGLEKDAGLHLGLARRIAKILQDRTPDVVFSHHLGPLIYTTLAKQMLLSSLRHVHVEHDGWHLEDAKNKRVWQQLYKRANCQLITISEDLNARMKALRPNKAATTILNGVSLEEFRPRPKTASRRAYDLPVNAFLIGGIGRLERVKGFDLLIDVLGKLPSNTHVALAGSGSEERALRQRVEAYRLEGRVHFLGHQANMPSLMPAFDVVCVPSRAEGLPLTVLEAQACGVPVVGADVGAMREALCPITGTLVEPEAIKPLARALMRQVLASPPLFDARATARAHVAKHFNWQTTVSAYQSVMGAA